MKQQSITLVPVREAALKVQEDMDNMIELLEIPMKLAVKLHVILDEIYANISQYSEATEAKIELICDAPGVIIRFRDNGTPFDPTKLAAPDTTLSADDRAIGGLGIHMVRKMSDSMEYERKDDWNILSVRLKGE